MYVALLFGWRPQTANWGLVSTLLMQYISAYRPADEFTEGPEAFIAYKYVDDGAFVDPWIGFRPVGLLLFGKLRSPNELDPRPRPTRKVRRKVTPPPFYPSGV